MLTMTQLMATSSLKIALLICRKSFPMGQLTICKVEYITYFRSNSTHKSCLNDSKAQIIHPSSP